MLECTPRLHVSIYAAPYEQLLSPRPCAWGLEFYALRSCFVLLLAIVSLCWHGVPPSPANVYTEPTSLLKGMHWKLEPVLAKTVGLAYPVRDLIRYVHAEKVLWPDIFKFFRKAHNVRQPAQEASVISFAAAGATARQLVHTRTHTGGKTHLLQYRHADTITLEQ